MNVLLGFISTVSALIALLFLVAFFMALFKSKMIVNKKRTRGQAIFVSILMVIIFSGITSTTSPKEKAQETKVASVNNEATKTPTPTDVPTTPTATPTPVATDANGFPMDYQAVTVAQIAKVPSAYEQKTVMFTCNVASFPKNSNGDAGGINCTDPNDYGSIIQVSGGLFDFTQINQGDTVKIYGTGSGAATGKNAFGGEVTEGLVDGLFINDLTTGYKN